MVVGALVVVVVGGFVVVVVVGGFVVVVVVGGLVVVVVASLCKVFNDSNWLFFSSNQNINLKTCLSGIIQTCVSSAVANSPFQYPKSTP